MMRRRILTAADQRGFTLIELMVTLTVMVVMLGIGVPAFKNFMATQRVKSASFDVATALLMARSEAVKRNRAITIAPVGADWAAGWTVKDSATTLMQQEATSGMTITASGTPVTYQPTGRVAAAATFDLASTTNTSARRCVKVDLTGVPTTSNGACS
jgi:type IV fimbrial biogenesis protein FimT